MSAFPLFLTHKRNCPTLTRPFQLKSDFKPSGDQPQAIKNLCQGLNDQQRDQVLMGVTGSGKTFTLANIIAEKQRPSLILAPNKTLAGQLYNEMKQFFPHNAVEYFVSYYDYYQPEAYVPKTDTYIEKDSSINEQIDRMRHSATRAILERGDTIIVASVSCIYGIGAVETYLEMTHTLERNSRVDPRELIKKLIEMQYLRNDQVLSRGHFRVKGDIIDIFPSHSKNIAWRLSFFDDDLEDIYEFDPLTGDRSSPLDRITIFANSHYVIPRPTSHQAIKAIKEELKERLDQLYHDNQLLAAQRLEQRTLFDLEMLQTTGSCKGIENYSRHLTGRKPGDPPPTLFEYLPDNTLLFIDESHVTVPQIQAMYRGDANRKTVLSDHGFRLPSCVDNRPLKFEEWNITRPDTIFISATPGPWELEQTQGTITEQIIRPTGLLDPEVDIRPVAHQVEDLMKEARKCLKKNQRVLITTLTKRMAEHLTDYLYEHHLKVRYLHSDVDTLERIEIIRDLRLGVFDILVGINLLREGLDIPECALVAIFDADKEGFLRSKTSLIQTIGRAARHIDGRVILYADHMTKSIQGALEETQRRRKKQQDHNKKHAITPKGVVKEISDSLYQTSSRDQPNKDRNLWGKEIKNEPIDVTIERLTKEMKKAAHQLDFEKAANLRDHIQSLQQQQLDMIPAS